MSELDKKQELTSICVNRLKELGLVDEKYRRKLRDEIIEIDVQGQFDYFLDHYNRGSYWNENVHNLLVPFLLGLCDSFDITQDSAATMGEWPDIDVDYIDAVREYLRYEWAPKVFGKDHVCNIGTYSTYNLKQSLLDMARVHGKDRYELLAITKQFATKDDDGDALTWESAIELYPAFRKYCEENPDVATSARNMCGRKRNQGQHAGGFIISSVPITDFVPLVRNNLDEPLRTAWSEGQSAQDLQEVGLIKLDVLSSEMQAQIADCIGMISSRYGIDKICALEDGPNWSDDSYLNDPDCMKMADRADLRFVFQFDSDGIRRLVKMGGADGFRDLEAYSALYRPSALSSKMHESYCNRKNKKEEYSIHPRLEPYLSKTYGVLVYQEDVMNVLNVAGGIPSRDCYDVIKAISKKKIEKFAKYKDLFISNCQERLDMSQEQAAEFWNYIEAFAGYGFNKAHTCTYTHVSARQLYLKCHYPVEFFCSRLNRIKGSDELLRDCKRDAESHGVRVNPIDLNRSLENFSIYCEGIPSDKDEIYFGLSKLKFVGEDVSRRIVELRNQRPFEGFEDFLSRFGTDAKVVQAVIALRLFDEADPVTLYSYYEAYKQHHKQQDARIKRFDSALEKYALQLKEITGLNYELSIESIERAIVKLEEDKNTAAVKLLNRMKGNFKRTMTNNASRSVQEMPSLKDFVCPENFKIKDDVLELLTDREKAEMHYYGFCWTSPMADCPDVEGFTFDKFNNANYGPNQAGPVEGIIQESREFTSKKGTRYRVVELMDANWECNKIYVWEDENVRFKPILRNGNFVRLRIVHSNFGTSNYNLQSYPRHKRHLAPPKDSDFRVVLLKDGTKRQLPEAKVDNQD